MLTKTFIKSKMDMEVERQKIVTRVTSEITAK